MNAKTQINKQTVFSGIQPTSSSLHLGNYLGAVKNWVQMQDKYDCIYSVVDLHSLTANENPTELRENTYFTIAQLLACGVDPNKCTLFLQSDVIEHSSLTWLLLCKTGFGELKRMTQFKDKSSGKKNISAGLFAYPALMAADILLYNTNFVPVGADQKQHLELSQTLAKRLNSQFNKKIVKVPKPLISDVPKVKNLQNPQNKMSKSSTEHLLDSKDSVQSGVINLLDSNKVIEKKIKSAVTDSLNQIKYDPENQIGLSNLIDIYSGVMGLRPNKLVEKYKTKMYGNIKVDLAKVLVEIIEPIREKTFGLLKDKKALDKIVEDGSVKAREIAIKNYESILDIFLGKTV